jgi:hypothetical protein
LEMLLSHIESCDSRLVRSIINQSVITIVSSIHVESVATCSDKGIRSRNRELLLPSDEQRLERRLSQIKTWTLGLL